MCWEAAAIVGSAAIGAYSSSKAASAQKSAAAGAAGLSEAQYQQTREDLAPWRALGGHATRELGSLYGFGSQPGNVIDEQGNPVSNGMAGSINMKDWRSGVESPNGLAGFGRGGDTEVAHLTPGETVVPRQVADRLPGGRNALTQAFRSDGADPGQYVVGGNDDSINPRTGMREFDYDGGAGGVSDPSGSDYGGGGGYDGGGNRDGGDPGFNVRDMLKNPAGPLGYGIMQAGRHLASPNPDGSYGYTDPSGYSRQDGGDPRIAGGPGGYAGDGQGAGGAPGTTIDIPEGYYNQENAMARFYDSPDYRINFDEGARALESSAAARGGLFSGNTGTALTRYGQDYGNRLYNQYANRLANFAGLGQTAATNTGQFGASAAGQQGNAMMAGGRATAQGWEGLANSINAGVGNAMYSNYMNQ